MTDVILAVIILAPLALTFLLKSDAALSFLALCAGFVVSTSAIGDLKHLLSEANLSVTDSTLGLILIVTPLLVTLLLTRHAASKGLKFYLQLLAALCAGGLLALSISPLISPSSQFDLLNSKFWTDLQKIQSAVVGVGVLLSLLLIWFKSLKASKKKHRL